MLLAASSLVLSAVAWIGTQSALATTRAPLPDERHLRNLRQLTFGGENAEAYFSFDGARLIFQSTRDGYPCDRIFTMKADGSDVKMVSTGTGRTTCGYFTPDGRRIVYASTHLGAPSCPPRPDFSRGYVWPIYPSYDIFSANADGTGVRRLTLAPGYDAEATIGPDGRIVFTSVRDGDMELYVMDADGSNVRRLTNRPGPDGGAFFSKDGSMIVWRGKVATDAKELADYRALLDDGLWRPMTLEIFAMRSDGSAVSQVTALGGSSFAPFFHPDGRRIIFASNHHDPKGRDFDLYTIGVDGSGLERITYNDSFDGFPMFTPDGRHLVFASNRHQAAAGETNIFIADWVE